MAKHSRSSHLNRTLVRLQAGIAGAVAIGAVHASERPSELSDSQRRLAEIRELIGNAAGGNLNGKTSPVDAWSRQINSMFAGIEKSSADASYCQEPGRAYLTGVDQDGTMHVGQNVELGIAGSFGHAYVTLTVEMSLSAAVAAINAKQPYNGVAARIAPENPKRIELDSVLGGSDQHVRVTQYGGTTPIVYAQPIGGSAMYTWTDYGCAFGVPNCAVGGELYLSTGPSFVTGHGNVTLFVHGHAGTQRFTFASGTSQNNIIGTLNDFQNALGVVAQRSPHNPDRVVIRSTLLGYFGSVQLQEVGGPPPMIYDVPIGGEAGYDMFDTGRDALAGDVDCNWVVNLTDLTLVLDGWGQCPQPSQACPPDVDGNGEVNVDDVLKVISNWGSQG